MQRLIRFPVQYSLNMLLRNTLFLGLTLFLQACPSQADQADQARGEDSDGGTCRLSSKFPSPEVTPWDRSNIKVSWKKVFENCLPKDIKALKVKVKTRRNSATSFSGKTAKLEDNEVLVDGSPCIILSTLRFLSLTKKRNLWKATKLSTTNQLHSTKVQIFTLAGSILKLFKTFA